MDDKRALIAQMAADISTDMAMLDDDRRRMFLNWLRAHRKDSVNISVVTLKDHLITWFEKLPVSGIAWEYRLILSEIAWWRDLDELSLAELIAAG